MAPFILYRTNERATKSVACIVLYAALFFVATRLLSGVLIGAASAAYEQLLGIPNPMGALRFGGSPEVAAERFGANTIWMLLLVAPLFEELAFRLALSFRRAHVAIGAGALAAFLAMRLAPAGSFFGGWGGAAVVAVAAAGLLYGCSPAGFWSSKRAAWQVAAGWCSAVGFGLAHLFAMEGLSWELLPFALLVCFMLACAGAVFVYLRVNLGFGWALGAHILNNIPALALLLSMQ